VSGVTKDGKPFSYEYSYADLASVSRAVYPLLAANGLAFTAFPTMTERGLVLAYSLLHVDGEKMTGQYPIAGTTPQQRGSEITYARRYCLCAVTGIAPDEDDDAAGAHSQRQADFPDQPSELSQARERVQAAWNFQYGQFDRAECEREFAVWSQGGAIMSADPGQLRAFAAHLSALPSQDAGSAPAGRQEEATAPAPMTGRQRGQLFVLMGEQGLSDKAAQLRWINRTLGTEYESRGHVTFVEAAKLIDTLKSGITVAESIPRVTSEQVDPFTPHTGPEET